MKKNLKYILIIATLSMTFCLAIYLKKISQDTSDKKGDNQINEVIQSEKDNQEKLKYEAIQKAKQNYIPGEKPLYINGILIVNKEFGIPRNFASDYNSEALSQYYKMESDAKKDGLEINIRSGYRTTEVQESLFNAYVKKDGLEKANRYSAKPGYSEHETGLAFDISNGDYVKSIGDWFTDTPQAKWLYENAHKYGFVLRYPPGKEHITGYKYESWHYRYIGVEHSKHFAQNNLTIEEYVGLFPENVNV